LAEAWHRTDRGPATRPRGAGRSGAFTLVEILVSVAIIAMLLAILLPALGHTIRAGRGFRCQMSQRSVAFDFAVFADDHLHGDRGNDTHDVGPRHFLLETFQESEYGLDEFWRWQGATTHQYPDASNNDPMRCSEVRGAITLQNNVPCSQGAISPARNVSYTFNMRLHRADTVGPNGQPRLTPVALTSRIMEHGRVPLLWDVNGLLAEEREQSPVFSAPSIGGNGVYSDGSYWFPARRHNGAVNVAFVDGSVSASADPAREPNWDWAYQPVR
jgi:prepilin-type processing-associated H-X9-DG protein/prepilin-type N-terminal cleavage/methylation domain-containing protein